MSTALIRTSMSGWRSLNFTSRGTSHWMAKLGCKETVSAPLALRASSLSVASEMEVKMSLMSRK